jgi:hypothetical protein
MGSHLNRLHPTRSLTATTARRCSVSELQLSKRMLNFRNYDLIACDPASNFNNNSDLAGDQADSSSAFADAG